MARLFSRLIIILSAATLIALATSARAGTLTTDQRVALQMKLIDYIDERTIDGKFLHFDADRKGDDGSLSRPSASPDYSHRRHLLSVRGLPGCGRKGR